MDISKLIEALNNPNSGAANQLLDYLSNSPLDPAAAFQQLAQAQPQAMPPLPGGPQAPMGGETTPPLGQMLSPSPPMQPAQLSPGVNPGSKGPWSFSYNSPNNGAPMTDPNNPNFVPPAAAQAASMDPNASLVEGEPNISMPGLDPRVLEGIAGMQEEEPRPMPVGGGGGGPGPRTVQLEQLQLPQAGRIPSLAELLRGV